MSRRIFLVVLLLIAALSSAIRAAEPTSAEKAIAEGLFQEAKKLYAAGKISEACAKFDESQKIAPGGGTILSLAICREDEGKLATALVLFQEALAKAKTAKREDRIKTANEHIAAIEPKVSKLTVTVAAGGELDGLEVKLDAVVLPKGGWGAEVPVDPGPHTVSASAPKKMPWSASVTIAATSDRKTVTVPKLEPVTKEKEEKPPTSVVPAASTPAPPESPTTSPAMPPPSTKDEPPKSSSLKTVGLVVGGVGVAALAGGVLFAFRAQSLRDEAQSLDSQGYFASSDSRIGEARTAQLYARIGVGVGLVAIGTGVALIVLAPPSKSTTAWIAPRIDASGGGLSLMGRF